MSVNLSAPLPIRLLPLNLWESYDCRKFRDSTYSSDSSTYTYLFSSVLSRDSRRLPFSSPSPHPRGFLLLSFYGLTTLLWVRSRYRILGSLLTQSFASRQGSRLSSQFYSCFFSLNIISKPPEAELSVKGASPYPLPCFQSNLTQILPHPSFLDLFDLLLFRRLLKTSFLVLSRHRFSYRPGSSENVCVHSLAVQTPTRLSSSFPFDSDTFLLRHVGLLKKLIRSPPP